MAENKQAPLPEISAKDAIGDTALIYAAIERALGVRLVNLVYRHLATVPGALEWAWAIVGEAFEKGVFAESSRTLEEILNEGDGDNTLPKRQVDLLSTVRSADRDRIIKTIDAYNRANPMNALSLRVISIALDRGRKAAFFPPRGTSGSALQELLPLLPLDGHEPKVSATLARLALLTTGKSGPVIPSLYRHFIPWPDFLDRLADWLEDLSSDGQVDRLSENVSARADQIALTLYKDLGSGSLDGLAPAAETRKVLIDTIEIFPPAICRMIVIGGLLRRELEPGTRSA